MLQFQASDLPVINHSLLVLSRSHLARPHGMVDGRHVLLDVALVIRVAVGLMLPAKRRLPKRCQLAFWQVKFGFFLRFCLQFLDIYAVVWLIENVSAY